MIKKNLMKVFLILLVFVAITSCEKYEFEEIETQEQVQLKSIGSTPPPISGTELSIEYLEVETCGEFLTYPILNPDNEEVGIMKISNDDVNLYIEFESTSDWKFLMTYMYAGTYADLPLNADGTPNLRAYNVQLTFPDYVPYAAIILPLENFDENLVVAPMIYGFNFENGSVIGNGFLWSGAEFIASTHPSKYSNYTTQECVTCEYMPSSYDIIAKRNQDIGDLVVVNDEEFLYVTYSLDETWFVQGLKMFVGDVSDLPMNRGGNPVVGHFPIKEHFDYGTNTVTYTFDINELPECLVIAVHSSVYQEINGRIKCRAAAWSFGTEFSHHKRWGWYSEYCLQHCE